MAFGITQYLSSADRTAGTNPVTTGNTFTLPIDLGSVSIPASGNTTSTPVRVFCKNTGTTTFLITSVQPTAGTLSGHADISASIDVAPDSGGSPGTWGADGASVSLGNVSVAPGATFDYWVRINVLSSATPAGTSANFPVFQTTLSVSDLG